MAKISEFGWMGGIVLQCTQCPSQFQMAAADPEAFEKVVQKIVDHQHIVEGMGSYVEQTPVVTGDNQVHQAGRDLHVSNRIDGPVHGSAIQAGVIHGGVEIPAKRRAFQPPSGGYLW